MAQQGYDSSSSSDMYVILMFVALFGGYLFLQTHFEYVVYVWRYLRIMELGLFYWIPDWIPFYGSLEIKGAYNFLINTDYDLIHSDTVAQIDNRYSGFFAWIPGMLCIYWGTKFIGKALDPTANFNMETLLARMQDFYPHVPQFVEDDPTFKDIEYNRSKKESYRWAMGLRPNDFAVMVPPLGLEEAAKTNKSLNAPIWDGAEGFDLDLAEKTFVSQLGDKFSGIDSLNVHERRLFDFLVKKIADDLELSKEKIDIFAKVILDHKDKDKKFDYITLSVSEQGLYDKLDSYLTEQRKSKKFTLKAFFHYKNIEKLMKDKSFLPVLKKLNAEYVMSMHAFKTTAFMALLETTRKVGVVPTLDFQWIKKHDRILHFALNSVGRKVAFAECSGCFCHYVLECQIGRPWSQPEVHEAVQGLYKALNLYTE
jgi:hypothetical protein